MDTQQMFQELDRLYAQGKLDEAEEKMMGWMKEGLDSGNKSLCLMMCNEMEGLYRNTGRVAQAVDMADMALSLIAGMGLDGSIHHGTTLLNAATARRMAGDVEKCAFPVTGRRKRFLRILEKRMAMRMQVSTIISARFIRNRRNMKRQPGIAG